MRAATAVLALSVLTAACGSAAAVPSVLQRYQALRPKLAATTLADTMLANDSARLGRVLAALRIDRVPARDIALKRDALRLQAQAGRAAASIRPLFRQAADKHVRAYFRADLTALANQWAEADELIHVADVLWWDPWLSSPGDARRATAIDGRARWNAWQAVRAARAAAVIRQRFRAAFRFVVVKNNAVGAHTADAPPGSNG